MSLRERHARTRLQVPFKGHRPAFVGKLHDDINDPRSPRGRMRTVASVVRIQSRRKTRRQPGVVAALIAGTLKNVDDALGRHVALTVRSSRPASAWTNLPGVASMRRDGSAIPTMRSSREERRFCEGKVGLPTVHLRGFAASVDILRESAYLSSLCKEFLRPDPERRLACHPKLALRSVVSEGWWTRPGSNR